MYMPLYDFFCMKNAPICINTLVRNIKIEIQFMSNNTEKGINIFGQAPNVDGGYCVGATLQIASTNISVAQQTQIAIEKKDTAKSEILSFIHPVHRNFTYDGSNSLVMTNVKYLHSLMLFSIAATSVNYGGDIVDTGGNSGQLVLTKRTATQLTNNFTDTGNGTSGLTNFSVSWGSNIVYPTSPLILATGSDATFSPRINEYITQFLLSTHRLGDRSDTLPMSAISMSRTCQFLYICPYSEQIHVEEQVADLIIRAQASTSAGYMTNITSLAYTIRLFEIEASGAVNQILV